MKHKIMLVEDDLDISRMVTERLIKEGYEVSPVFDGEEALRVFNTTKMDVLLLDLMLPKLDGMEFLKIIRSESMIPVLIMSAKDEDVDKAIGLGFGADDYITKPFSMIELVARIKALLRREQHYLQNSQTKVQENIQSHELKVGDLTIDIDNFTVKKGSMKLNLTRKEFSILKLFVTKPDHVYTKSQIYNLVWEDDYYGDENVINVHIRRLREKIEDDPSNPLYIKTLWGIGYKLGEV